MSQTATTTTPAPAPGRATPDEHTLRRPDALIETSEAIVLADGQAWYFPKPRVFFRPTGEDLGYEFVSSLSGEAEGFDPTFGNLLAEFEAAYDRAASDSTEPTLRAALYAALMGLKLRLYRTMLRRNYNLTPEVEQAILCLEIGGETDRVILDVVMGRTGPKLSGGGDDLGSVLAE